MPANVTVFFHIQAVEYFVPSFLFCSCLEGISLGIFSKRGPIRKKCLTIITPFPHFNSYLFLV